MGIQKYQICPQCGRELKRNRENFKRSVNKETGKDIFLSKHNTYILSADTIDELMKKVKDMEFKNIIVSEDAIENNNDTCNY